jgi:hypothetical protein
MPPQYFQKILLQINEQFRLSISNKFASVDEEGDTASLHPWVMRDGGGVSNEKENSMTGGNICGVCELRCNLCSLTE